MINDKKNEYNRNSWFLKFVDCFWNGQFFSDQYLECINIQIFDEVICILIYVKLKSYIKFFLLLQKYLNEKIDMKVYDIINSKKEFYLYLRKISCVMNLFLLIFYSDFLMLSIWDVTYE